MIKHAFISLLMLLAGCLGMSAIVSGQSSNSPTFSNHRFHTISLEDGLSQSTVNDIMQDRLGFMWIATQDGINRYDGYSFKIYSDEPGKKNSLSTPWTTSLEQDSSGAIWIGTYGGGLNRLDPVTEQFRHFKSQKNDSISLIHDLINCLYIDRNNRLWIGTQEGLSMANLNNYKSSAPDSLRFLNINTRSNPPLTLTHNNVTDITEDENGNIVIATLGGGLTFFSEDLETKKIIKNTDGNKILSSNYVRSIHVDDKNHIWVGTDGNGITVVNNQGQTLSKFTKETAIPLSGNNIRAIHQDYSGIMWIGTSEEGVTLIDLQNQKAMHFKADSRDSYSIAHNSIYTIEEDANHNLWFGTFLNGISVHSLENTQFNHIGHDPDNPNSLNYNVVSSIYEDSTGNVWISTRGGGLNKLNFRSYEFKHFTHSPTDAKSISGNNVRYLYPAGDGKLWVGTWGDGLDLFDMQAEEVIDHFEHDPRDPTSIQDNRVRVIFKDSFGNLWVATGENDRSALNLFDPETRSFKKFKADPEDTNSLPDNTVNYLHETENRTLWIASYGGISRVTSDLEDPNELTMVNYTQEAESSKKILGNIVSSINSDSQGSIWASSYGVGINKIEVNEKQNVSGITFFSEEDGLKNVGILGIIGDDDGRLWMSTNHGLAMFDTDTNKKIFRHFIKSDGVRNNQFNQTAFHRGKSGRIYFGGTNGVTYFHPDSLDFRTKSPPVYITKFRVYDQPVSQDSNITYKNRVALDYHQEFFSFNFAALDYNVLSKQKYAYKLEGFDENWINSGTRNFASYTNLDPGSYTFKVAPVTSTSEPGNSLATLQVDIIPPFWMTGLFRLSVILALIGIIWGGVRLRERRLRTLKIKLEQKVQEQTAELKQKTKEALKANQAKSEFLAGISHELRTPLNAIIGFTQILIRDEYLSAKNNEYVNTISRSANHLLNMINDVLDISKIEAGRMELHPDTFNLSFLTKDLYDMFRIKCDEKRLNYIYNFGNQVPEYINADAGKIRQILINLIGNAVKYTPSGSITFNVRLVENELAEDSDDKAVIEFEIIDTGKGITEEKKEKIFTPFTRDTHSSSEGTGLGLAITHKMVDIMNGEMMMESSLGEGSVFTVRLPVLKAEPPEVDSSTGSHYLKLAENHKVKALVVDDVSYNLVFTKTLLEQAGFEIYEAEDGQEAVDKYRQYRPEIVIMDIKMPKMDGVEAMNKIRKLEQNKQPCIVAASASVFEKSSEDFIKNGFDDFLLKPFHAEDLLGKLEKNTELSFEKDEIQKITTKQKTESEQFDSIARNIQNLHPEKRQFLIDAIDLMDFEAISELERGDFADFKYINDLTYAAREKNYRYFLTLSEELAIGD